MNKRIRTATQIAACICISLLTGCSTRVGDFTVMSTKNMDFNNPDGFMTQPGRRVTGESIQHFAIIIPVSSAATMKGAVDNAIERTPGAVGLSNVVLYQTGFWAILYGNGGYRVEGDPVYPKSSLPPGIR